MCVNVTVDSRAETRYEVVSKVVRAGETLSIPERATEPIVEPTGRPNLVRVTYLQALVDVPVDSTAADGAPTDRYIR